MLTNNSGDRADPKQRILLVCGQAGERTKLAQLLEAQSFIVRACDSAEAARAMADKQPFALALICHQSLGEDSVELSSQLKQRRQQLRTVVVAGLAQRAGLKRGQLSGAIDGFFSAPWGETEMLALLHEQLQSSDQSPTIKPSKRKNAIFSGNEVDSNSLLYQLSLRHPGILQGSWEVEDQHRFESAPAATGKARGTSK